MSVCGLVEQYLGPTSQGMKFTGLIRYMPGDIYIHPHLAYDQILQSKG